ncbi:MAG TPA: hypothetical protein DCX06_01995 [Opitutae bacterium]|nr:hypothetical protein [Opitutae bacterium]
MYYLRPWFIVCCLCLPSYSVVAERNEAVEPSVQGEDVIFLIEEDSLKGWTVPSDRWSVDRGVVIGDTGPKPIHTPEWLYSESRFADFIFSAELKLTGSLKPNSGVYFRVNPILYQRRENAPTFEAAAGYEYDVVAGKFLASLGDWYARPKLRILAERAIIDRLYNENDWNRMTLRARGNRLEYWLNGVKVLDYMDVDPKGSREGIIGLQIHDNAVMKIEMRNAHVLPITSD